MVSLRRASETEDVLHRIAAFVARELRRELLFLIRRIEVPGRLHGTGERLRVVVGEDECNQLVRDNREELRQVQLLAERRERVSHAEVRPSVQVRCIDGEYIPLPASR